jgi:hypothetical protein
MRRLEYMVSSLGALVLTFDASLIAFAMWEEWVMVVVVLVIAGCLAGLVLFSAKVNGLSLREGEWYGQ